MKRMDEVFVLPVDGKKIEMYGYESSRLYDECELYAAHAINHADALADALDALLAASIRMAGKDDFYTAQDSAQSALKAYRGEK